MEPLEDAAEVSRQFEAELRATWIERKLRIDTSALPPTDLLAMFLRQVKPLLDTRDLLRWQAVGEG